MCVICICRRNGSRPNDNELRDMRRVHPDGMGFVSETMSYKGLSFETFLRRFHAVPTNENVIIHFRYATNGSVKKRNCHPFKDENIWFAHNGVLGIPTKGDITDSEAAFRGYIMPIVRLYGYGSPEMDKVVNTIVGRSKFAFMRNGEIKTYGRYEQVEDRLYSNTRHLWTRQIAIYPPAIKGHANTYKGLATS